MESLTKNFWLIADLKTLTARSLMSSGKLVSIAGLDQNIQKVKFLIFIYQSVAQIFWSWPHPQILSCGSFQLPLWFCKRLPFLTKLFLRTGKMWLSWFCNLPFVYHIWNARLRVRAFQISLFCRSWDFFPIIVLYKKVIQ